MCFQSETSFPCWKRLDRFLFEREGWSCSSAWNIKRVVHLWRDILVMSLSLWDQVQSWDIVTEIGVELLLPRTIKKVRMSTEYLSFTWSGLGTSNDPGGLAQKAAEARGSCYTQLSLSSWPYHGNSFIIYFFYAPNLVCGCLFDFVPESCDLIETDLYHQWKIQLR